MQRVEHPHARGGHRHEREKRQHDSRQEHRQLELAGDAAVRAGEQLHERLREHDSEDDEEAGDDDQAVDDVVGEAPRGLLARGREMPRERRHEGAAHGALGKQVAHEVGNAIGDVVRVHRVAGAEERRQHLFADDAEDAARHRRSAGRRGGTREGRGGRRGGVRRQACGGPPR